MANESTEEQISALVDGELQGRGLQRALDALGDESSLKERWTRYHLISDALRSNLPEQVHPQLHERVWRALEEEPTVLAPRRRAVKVPPLVRQAAGLAIAASVTAIAILGVQTLNGVDERTGPAVAKGEYGERGIAVAEANEAREGSRELDPYVLNHSEYAASTGMQGMLPYVRIVSHETSR